MREDAKPRLIRGSPHERRLQKVDARAPSGLEEYLLVAEDVDRLIDERPMVVQVRRAEVREASRDIQSPSAAEQIVRRVIRFETAKEHIVEPRPDARVVQWCLDHLDLDAFHAVAGRRQNAGESEEARSVKRPLAL